jgi:hypothetical protein
MMARDLASYLDPVLLARDCGIEPDTWQAQLIRERPRRSLLLCCRQAGKSTVTALIALWTAIFEAPALVLLVSPSQRQSAELFRTVMLCLGHLEGAPALTMSSVLRAEFANGSRILALPGTERTVRGYAKADLVVIDEAARVEDELLAAVRPMLATIRRRAAHRIEHTGGQARVVLRSMTRGDPAWHRVRVPASECPRITQDFLDEELKELGAQRFSEEYSLQFLDPDEAVFPTTIIDAAFSHEVLPLWN